MEKVIQSNNGPSVTGRAYSVRSMLRLTGAQGGARWAQGRGTRVQRSAATRVLSCLHKWRCRCPCRPFALGDLSPCLLLVRPSLDDVLLHHVVPAPPCPDLALTLLCPCTGPALTYNRLQYSSLYCTTLYSAASRHQHGSPKTLKHPDTPPHPPTSSPLPPPRVPAIPPATHHLLLPPHRCPQDACLTQTASFSPTLVVVWPCLIVGPSASPRPAVRVRFLRDSRSIQPVHLPHPHPHPHHPDMTSSPARSTTLLILLLWAYPPDHSTPYTTPYPPQSALRFPRLINPHPRCSVHMPP